MNNEIKYQLGDTVPQRENFLLALQHVIFFVASAVVMPVVVGYALGLSQTEVADTLQRTFFSLRGRFYTAGSLRAQISHHRRPCRALVGAFDSDGRHGGFLGEKC